jgi:hypothetical protein
LAAEERHSAAVVRCEQARWLREAKVASRTREANLTWLRRTAGLTLVRLGQRLQGSSTSVAATSATG